MEGQSNIPKSFLITAVVCTMVLGSPVNRDAKSNSVIKACEAAKVTKNFCLNTTLPSHCNPFAATATYDEDYAAEFLLLSLQRLSFTGAVSEALWKCFNSSGCDSGKCELATTAITLWDTIKNFICEFGWNNMAWITQIDHYTPRGKVDVQQTLCTASMCTLEILGGINDGFPYVSCLQLINSTPLTHSTKPQ